ncbi:transketolase C-terminal domain-containing protein [Candidatus Acidulodesulfobacterium sp. H_13]|uniref:transketolase C-terminal domain-containing protein n=1 Tax=Candidatus Acidulodesulfobacterium sp. H_13 TaxID=3395470 RepID=UPI003AF429EB
MRQVLEGSMAVSDGVRMVEPHVISAYPITPQTHIVEHLSKMVADGNLKSEFIMVESEHSAASVVLGASACGVRTYTATASQGLIYMEEVIYNIAGMRLPVVLTVANRALSAPINIWNDMQDAMAIRDTGAIMLVAENNQEAYDMHIQAFKIAENPDVMLPVVVNVDGFVLTHTFEIVETIDSIEKVREYLPPLNMKYKLDVDNPYSFGTLGEPSVYMESRYNLYNAMNLSKKVIVEAAGDFKNMFGKFHGALTDTYKMDDANTVIIAMGSVIGTIKDAVDELRESGKKIGVLKIRSFRPFPEDEIVSALRNAENVIVIEKAVSPGKGGILSVEIRDTLYKNKMTSINVNGYILGLGGRDITPKNIYDLAMRAEREENVDGKFIGLRRLE